MDNIKEELQTITRMRELQDKVIVLRQELPTAYEGYIKKQTGISARKLVNSKINVETPKLNIRETENINFDDVNKQQAMNIADVYEQASNIEKCLKFLAR